MLVPVGGATGDGIEGGVDVFTVRKADFVIAVEYALVSDAVSPNVTGACGDRNDGVADGIIATGAYKCVRFTSKSSE